MYVVILEFVEEVETVKSIQCLHCNDKFVNQQGLSIHILKVQTVKTLNFDKKNRWHYTVAAVRCLFVAVHVLFIFLFIPFYLLLSIIIFIKKISASDCSYIVFIFRGISSSIFLLSLLLMKRKSV